MAQNGHLDDFQQFLDDLNHATKSTLRENLTQYSGVYVLLWSWEADDLGTLTEIEELGKVFQDIYNYDTEHHRIPSVDSELELDDKLHAFRRAHGDPSNLLILYYGGHGQLDRRHNPSRSVWAAYPGGPSLIWSNLQPGLELAKADVVFILDCCYAATASRAGGSKEGLWACNSEVMTTDVNDNSFTRNMIEELKQLSSKSYNIAILHARLMRRFKAQGKSKLLTEPWYSFLGDAMCPSIQLSPQVTKQPLKDASPSKIDHAFSAQPGPEPSPQIMCRSDPALTETLVLLAVRMKDSGVNPEIEQWISWCREKSPSDIEYVHALGKIRLQDLVRVEANYLSHSSLLLVSMPIFIWDRLNYRSAYSFVGFIKSQNRLSQDQAKFSSSLARFSSLAPERSQIAPGDTERGVQVLCRAVKEGDVATVISLLEAGTLSGGDLNIKDGDGFTPLHLAVQHRNPTIVNILLRKNASINVQDRVGYTPLYIAVKKDCFEIVTALLQHGALANKATVWGSTPLHKAARKGNFEMCSLLLEYGAVDGAALEAALSAGHEKIVQLLVASGADVNAQAGQIGHYGNALQAASGTGHEQIVQLLVDHGANVNARGGFYDSALQAASAAGHEQIVQLLLDHGADINAQGGVFGNALKAASYNRHERIVQLLMEHGASFNVQSFEKKKT